MKAQQKATFVQVKQPNLDDRPQFLPALNGHHFVFRTRRARRRTAQGVRARRQILAKRGGIEHQGQSSAVKLRMETLPQR